MSIDAPPPPPPPPPPRDEPVADPVDLPIVEDAPTPQDSGSPGGRPGNTDATSAPLSPATDAPPGHASDMETPGSRASSPDTSSADPVDQPIAADASAQIAPRSDTPPAADPVDRPIVEDAAAPLADESGAAPGRGSDLADVADTPVPGALSQDTPPAADPVDGPVVDDTAAPTAPQEVEEPVSAGTWDEAAPVQGASPSLSQEMADTPAATAGSMPEASHDSLRPDAPPAPDPLQLSDGSTEQPQSLTETALIGGDGADTRPGDERMFSDVHVHQALNRENDNLKGDGPKLQADTLTGLPPDASIVEGSYVYGTDSLGRVTQAYASKLELEPGIRTRSELASARGLGQPGDDAGHLIAARFGGSDSTWNLAPQDSNLNRGAWNQMERQWSNAVEMGHTVSINVMANYVGDDMRPASYSVQYWIDGEIEQTVSYQNLRGG